MCFSYTGLVLVAAELSENVFGVSGANTDFRETGQPLVRDVKLGTHLRNREKVECEQVFTIIQHLQPC